MKHKTLYSILAVLFLAATALVFFYPDAVEGNVLMQHDIQQGLANGHEGELYREATGNTTRWTNSLFGGMPTFQISPSYTANGALGWLAKAYTLWLPSPAGLLFSMMLGFFIMMLCFRKKWYISLFGAVAWGFSSYFIIIIGAGHIWKFLALSFIPPTIGGIALCYRGRYVAGTALAALFGALQLQANHPQMSYYFFFVIIAMAIAWLVKAIRNHEAGRWGISTGCVVLAGALALAANSSSIYHTYKYAKETERGRSTELTTASTGQTTPAAQKDGLSFEYITAWSYGPSETFTLLIPNVKGGASIKPVAGDNKIKGVEATPKATELYEQSRVNPDEYLWMQQFTQYFGDQPMTNGPVYVGAFVLLLAILALFICEGGMKWALLAVSILAILLSWGAHLEPFSRFFIDNIPGYNRFRTVSSILVIVEFTIPLLACMALKKIVETPDFLKKYGSQITGVMGVGALICLMGTLFPSIFGSDGMSSSETEQLAAAGAFAEPQLANVLHAIRESRLALVSSDCLRSLIFILVGYALLYLYGKGRLGKNPAIFVCTLTVLVLIDLFSIDKRYVNSENFMSPQPYEETFEMTSADRRILADQSNYRVLDVKDFGGARSSYFHKTIGGYHAAKLTRYNDLIEHQIMRGNQNVLNMLNAKYIMSGDSVEVNPAALGNAWFVSNIEYVDSPNAEMQALDNLDPAHSAVADRKFASILGNAIQTAPDDTIFETSYAPNRLSYKSRSARGGVAVFSEIFFPWGWDATVDGKKTDIGRVNYVLRSIRVPAGEHEIVMTFDPQSVKTTETVSLVALILIYVLCAGALVIWGLKKRKY